MSSFPKVSFLITLLFAAAVCIQGQVTVKDTDGNPVEISKQYFLLPVKTGGALVPAPQSPFSFCPLGIAQIPLPFIWGPPVSFANILSGSNKTIVDTYTDLTIEFHSNPWPVCTEFSKFLEVKDTGSVILIGGNPKRTSSWFQIKEAGANTYEFTTSCGTVGTIPGPWFGAPQLVLTNDAAKNLFVKFKKLGDATVKDTNGNPVEVGKKYYIESLSDYGGSLIPFPVDPSVQTSCPLRITLKPEFPGGTPVSFAFTWSGTTKTIVDTYSDVTIEFKPSFWKFCVDFSKFWEYDESVTEPKILVGGKPKRTNTWFKIKEAGVNIYEFTTSTGTVGVNPEGSFGLSELVLTNDTSKIVRVKFHDADYTVSTSTSRVEKLGLRLAME